MKPSIGLLLVAGTIGLSGCNRQELLEKFAPKEESAFAQGCIDDLRARRFDDLAKKSGPELQGADVPAKLHGLAATLPESDPRSVELVGSHVFQSPDRWRATFTYQYEFAEGWLLATVVVDRVQGQPAVQGLHLQRIPDSLQRINAFTFAGKGPLHFVFLGAGILVLGFMLATFVLCLRTRGLRKKSLWALCTLLGAVSFSLNWTTGAVGFQLLSVQLLGVGGSAVSYGPWMFKVALPVGAVFFLREWLRLRRQAAAPPQPASPDPDPDTAPPA